MERLEYIKELFRQYLAKTISDRDRDELMQFFANSDQAQIEEVIGSLSADEHLHIQDLDRYDARAERILGQIRRTTTRPTRSLFIKVLPYAAAILVFLSVGIYYYWHSQDVQPTAKLTSIYGDDVAPGGNRATITLDDGTVMELAEDKDGIIAYGTELTYTSGEKLLTAPSEVQYATLTTPRGGQYQITLPDGSKVWLNAASSITYPARFEGAQRTVKLQGEAYFDIAENKAQPFIVETEGQQLTVTGTTFNVDAYADSETIITTLVSGSVNIADAEGSTTVKLQPGQQALLHHGRFTTKKVDTQVATAWVRGEFVFHYTTLAEILPQLERWYDIEVDIDPIPQEEFYAEIKRNMPLSTVLKAIEETSNVKFEIKGRRLLLRKK